MKGIYKKTPSMYKQLRLYYYITAWLYISICIILSFASPHHQEWIFTGWPDFWTINSVHHVSLTFYNVCLQEFTRKKSPQTFFVQPLEMSNWCYENTHVFPPFTSRIWKKQVISTCEKSHHRLAYAHCATGEAKAKSTGAAYEEVKVAKDQLNMAFVEKSPFRIVLQLQFFWKVHG